MYRQIRTICAIRAWTHCTRHISQYRPHILWPAACSPNPYRFCKYKYVFIFFFARRRLVNTLGASIACECGRVVESLPQRVHIYVHRSEQMPRQHSSTSDGHQSVVYFFLYFSDARRKYRIHRWMMKCISILQMKTSESSIFHVPALTSIQSIRFYRFHHGIPPTNQPCLIKQTQDETINALDKLILLVLTNAPTSNEHTFIQR